MKLGLAYWYWLRRFDQALRRRRRIVVLFVPFLLSSLAAVAALVPIPRDSVMRVQDWDGVFNYTGFQNTPRGWIHTPNLRFTKDDSLPVEKNLTGNGKEDFAPFSYVQGTSTAVTVTVFDQGLYRTSPLLVSARSFGVVPSQNTSLSFLDVTNSNYDVDFSPAIGRILVSFGGLIPYSFPTFTINTSDGGTYFLTEFHFWPLSNQSAATLMVNNVSLLADGQNRANLTGQAVLAFSGYSRVGLSVSMKSYNLVVLEGSRLSFPSASMNVDKVYGQIQSPQAGIVPLEASILKVASSVSIELDALPSFNDHDQSTKLAFRARAPTVTVVTQGVSPNPGADSVESSSWRTFQLAAVRVWAGVSSFGFSNVPGQLLRNKR